MSEEKTEKRSCDLNLMLVRYGGVNTSYDAKAGLRRSFVLSGRIDDPYRRPCGDIDESASDSAFHDKPVRVEISSLPDPDWLEEIRAARQVDDACGMIVVRAGVEPKRFELDGETLEVEPVTMMLAVGADAFEVLRRQAAEAYDHHRIMWATVTLAGNSLPKLESAFIFLKDIDVSEPRKDVFSGFKIFDSRYTDHLRARVRKFEVKRGRDEGYGAYVSVLLTGARYKIHAERALFHSITCDGRVLFGRGKPYDGIDVTVEFSEHESNRHGELPERAFFGEFGYYPKLPEERHSSTHFVFNLRYLPGDARTLLIPLLSQDAGTQVLLTINLTSEEAELLGATDEIRGNVRHYSFEVWRRLVDYSSILKRLDETRKLLEQRIFDDNGRFSPGKGASEEQFQRILRSLVAGGRVPDMELHVLSLEQIDALTDELCR